MRPSTSSPYCFTVPTTPTMVMGRFGIAPDVLADRVVVRPETLRELLVDHATGCAFGTASNSVKNRPFTSGISIVRK